MLQALSCFLRPIRRCAALSLLESLVLVKDATSCRKRSV